MGQKGEIKTTADKIWKDIKRIGDYLVGIVVISIALATVWLTVLGIGIGLSYVSEKITDQISPRSEIEVVAKLDKKNSVKLASHGEVEYGSFITSKGDTIKMNDFGSISDWKLYANRWIPNMQVDSAYKITAKGNETRGWTVIKAEPAKMRISH